MLRVGAQAGDGDRFRRIDIDGATFEGDDPANKQVPLLLSDRWYGRAQA